MTTFLLYFLSLLAVCVLYLWRRRRNAKIVSTLFIWKEVGAIASNTSFWRVFRRIISLSMALLLMTILITAINNFPFPSKLFWHQRPTDSVSINRLVLRRNQDDSAKFELFIEAIYRTSNDAGTHPFLLEIQDDFHPLLKQEWMLRPNQPETKIIAGTGTNAMNILVKIASFDDSKNTFDVNSANSVSNSVPRIESFLEKKIPAVSQLPIVAVKNDLHENSNTEHDKIGWTRLKLGLAALPNIDFRVIRSPEMQEMQETISEQAVCVYYNDMPEILPQCRVLFVTDNPEIAESASIKSLIDVHPYEIRVLPFNFQDANDATALTFPIQLAESICYFGMSQNDAEPNNDAIKKHPTSSARFWWSLIALLIFCCESILFRHKILE
ncbi:MAG: hypothetical protein ACRCUY_05495 [Thermoguttaceae bacterium]